LVCWNFAIMNARPVAALTMAVALIFGSVADASELPTPGSAQLVAQLVAKSNSIATLPASTVPQPLQAASDTPGHFYPSANQACVTTTQCVFGATTSSQVMVLYGDSHAQMWLPALVPVAQANGMRLVLIWHPGCPVVTLRTSWPICSKFRQSAISLINSLHARLVLLANKNTSVVGPNGITFTSAQWQAAMQATITALASSTTKVAVVEDDVLHNTPVPSCVVAYSTNIQHCAVVFPNPKYTNKIAPERAAALATGAGYIATQKWLCAAKCSPIVGSMFVYFDDSHVAATYAAFLSGVWSTAIAKILK
jgi:hypothetical protein